MVSGGFLSPTQGGPGHGRGNEEGGNGRRHFDLSLGAVLHVTEHVQRIWISQA